MLSIYVVENRLFTFVVLLEGENFIQDKQLYPLCSEHCLP